MGTLSLDVITIYGFIPILTYSLTWALSAVRKFPILVFWKAYPLFLMVILGKDDIVSTCIISLSGIVNP